MDMVYIRKLWVKFLLVVAKKKKMAWEGAFYRKGG